MMCYTTTVSGTVQGVGFRQATRRQARWLGLVGHALNLADGRVEVRMCGRRDALAELESWLWQGPPAAQVTDVSPVVGDSEPAPDDFTTG
ncbi:acylphosphatase [Vreelandella jeotgali]|uniref:acylphosphatase n=1 Tax=Vreelandella jeotgali TaxID=553386 RepID=UPI00034D43BA|nr:acylphosphatase [Halomonas jeotgali]